MIHMQYPAAGDRDRGEDAGGLGAEGPERLLHGQSRSATRPPTSTARHRIRIEGRSRSPGSCPRATTASRPRADVNVADGLLTIDAVGGTNTKLDYVTVTNDVGGSRPSVTKVTPADGSLRKLPRCPGHRRGEPAERRRRDRPSDPELEHRPADEEPRRRAGRRPTSTRLAAATRSSSSRPRFSTRAPATRSR